MSKFAAYAAITAATVASDDLLLLKDTSAVATTKLPLSDMIAGCLRVSTGAVIVTSSVLSVGANLATNPAFQVDYSASSVATGLKVTGAAAASGLAVAVVSSGTNENLTIDAKGSGTIALNATGTGNVITTRPVVITSASANAFAVGRQGTTNPGLLVDASTATNVTGLQVKPAAAAAGLDLSVISSGTNENLTVNAKGSGTISLNPTGTGNVITPRPVVITSASATAFAVGRQGTTNPGLLVDASTSTNVTGIQIKPAAAAAGCDLSVISSGTDENLTINAKGAGTIALNPTGTGSVITTRPVAITSASATAFAVGRQGTTNPGFLVDASTSTNVTGLQVKPAAAAAGCDLSVISSGTNENLTINAKGSGTIALNPTGTGNVITTRPIVVTSASANALAVGLAGTTNPALVVDASTASSATGLKVKSAAAAAGFAVSVVTSGTNEALTIDAAGSGSITLNGTATGNVTTPRGLVSTGATAGVGYATGAGGTVTQATDKSTGVTLNKVCGQITTNNASLAAGAEATFTWTNSAIAATDVVVVCVATGGTAGAYAVSITAVAAGSCGITITNLSAGALGEALVLNCIVIKGVAA